MAAPIVCARRERSAVIRGEVCVVVTITGQANALPGTVAGSAKVTPFSEYPGKGRATAALQTPGGSGALRLAADLMARMGTKGIWLGLPSWPNHASIFKAAGLDVVTYPFFDIPSQAVLFDRMMEALSGAAPGVFAPASAAVRRPDADCCGGAPVATDAPAF